MSQNKYSSSVDAIIEGLRRRQEEAPAQDESQVDDILASLGREPRRPVERLAPPAEKPAAEPQPPAAPEPAADEADEAPQPPEQPPVQEPEEQPKPAEPENPKKQDELPTGEVLLEEDDQGEFSTGAEITDEFATFFTTPVMEQEEPQWTVSGFLSRKKKTKEPENQTSTGEVALDLNGQTAEEEPDGDTIQLNAFEEQTGERPLPPAEEETAGPDEPTRRLDGAEEPKPHKNPLLRLFGREEPGEAPFAGPEPEAEEAPALEYNALQDAPAVSEVLAKQNARLTLTSALCALIAAVMLYLGVTATGVIAPLSALDPAIAPGAFLGVELTLLAAGCLLALPVLKTGLKGLTKAAPSRDSLAALAAVGAVLQLLLCFLMLESYEPERMTLFAPLAVLALACTLAGHRVMGESVARNFDLVSAGVEHSAAYRLQNRDLTNLLASGLGEEEPCLLVSRPTALVKDFLKRSGSRRAGDRLAQRLAWGLGGVAVITAVVALVRGKGVLVAAGALAGTLCMGAPLCATLIAGMTSWMQQRAASRVGAVVPGWSSMEELGQVNTIVTEGHDLFPTGCVTLHGLKTFEKERIDLAILYAASVLIAGCDTLRDLFLEIIQNRTEILYKVESLTCEQGKGFTAWVDGHRIVIGGRAMMTAHQVGIPSHDWEERYTHGRLQPVYLAVSGKLFGMFVVGYQGSREIAASLHTLQKSGLSLLVRTDDFSLTSDLIEQAYRLRPGSVKVLTENETNQLATATGYLPESEGCMVHLGSLASYVGGLHAAACAVSAEKSANLVMAVSVAVSALVALVLSFSGGLASLALPAAVLYQLAWAVPALALPLTRNY